MNDDSAAKVVIGAFMLIVFFLAVAWRMSVEEYMLARTETCNYKCLAVHKIWPASATWLGRDDAGRAKCTCLYGPKTK